MHALVEKIKENILNEFDSMAKVVGVEFDSTCEKLSGTRLRKRFVERCDELNALYEPGDIDPHFDLNLHFHDKKKPVSKGVSIAFFPFAGNPPHWGHLMSALDALIDCKLDKIIFVSNGNDPRKPDLLSTDIRYPMIQRIVDKFAPFFEFSTIAQEAYFDDTIPMLGEYTLFRFFKLNKESGIRAYYFAGSDHLHRTVVKNAKESLDTVGLLESCVDKRLFDFDPQKHTVIGLFNARDVQEYEANLKEISQPKIELQRLNPSISFSSTQLRDALSGKGPNDALILLAHCNYEQILEKGLYR